VRVTGRLARGHELPGEQLPDPGNGRELTMPHGRPTPNANEHLHAIERLGWSLFRALLPFHAIGLLIWATVAPHDAPPTVREAVALALGSIAGTAVTRRKSRLSNTPAEPTGVASPCVTRWR